MTTTDPIYGSAAYGLALTEYGTDTVPYDALVWQRFVGIYNIDVTQSLSSSEEKLYQTFLRRYHAWNLGSHALMLGNYYPSTNTSMYLAAINSVFSNLSDQEKLDIWNGFLDSLGLTATPTSGAGLPQMFTEYVQGLKAKQEAYVAPADGDYDPDDVLQIELMKRFFEATGFSPTDDTTSQAEQLFRQFLQRYALWGVTLAAIKDTSAIPAEFLPCLNALYGNRTEVEREDLWHTFLQSVGLPSPPQSSGENISKFYKFLSMVRAKEAQAEATTGLSLQESTARICFNGVLTCLEDMLNTTETSVRLQATTLTYLGLWQEEYTEMMTSVPNLQSVADSLLATSKETTIRLPSGSISTWDFSDFTFGYDSISLVDITNWAVSSLDAATNPSVTFGSIDMPMGAYTFTLSTSSTGKQSVAVSVSMYVKQTGYENDVLYSMDEYPPEDNPRIWKLVTAGGDGEYSFDITDDTGWALPFTAEGLINSIQVDSVIGNAEVALRSLFTAATEIVTRLEGMPDDAAHPFYIEGIQGRYLEPMTTIKNSDGDEVVDTTETQNRTDQNALLQQYVETIRARREVVSERTTQLQSLLSSGRDSINKVVDLWTTILAALNDVVKAIFKQA